MVPSASSRTNSDPDHNADGPAAAKALLRTDVLTARRSLTPEALAQAETALLAHLTGLPELASARTVAAYVSVGTEPRTQGVLAWLLERDVRVLLPVLLPDNDLDWARYRGPDDLAPASRGLREPTGPRVGPDAVAEADVVLLPGVAADSEGFRMGRGGGSYDRAMERVRRRGRALTVLLLHTGEDDRQVPVEPHDLPVDVVVTPQGLTRHHAEG